MEPNHVIIILLVVALIVLALRLASRPGARAGSDLQALLDSVRQLENHARDQHRISDELHKTLHSPNRRGKWAEQSLANLLENSGLRKDHDYQLQLKIDIDDGYQQPDAVVFMPYRARSVRCSPRHERRDLPGRPGGLLRQGVDVPARAMLTRRAVVARGD